MKEEFINSRSRGEEARAAIEESREDFNESIRQAGEEVLKIYTEALSKIHRYGPGEEERTIEMGQVFSLISKRLHAFPLDEREIILGEVIANISTAIKSTNTDYIQSNTQETMRNPPWSLVEGTKLHEEIFNYLEKRLEKGDISSAGAVFRQAFHRSESSQQKQLVIDFLFARHERGDDYEYFPFAEKAIEEIKDEVREYLFEQKECALLITNNNYLQLSYKQATECITTLRNSRESELIQWITESTHPHSTSPLVHAIKDVLVSQMNSSEYQTFLEKLHPLNSGINPLFINNALLLQWNLESIQSQKCYFALRHILQLPEVNDEVALRLGAQIVELENYENSEFYTVERLRAFLQAHSPLDLNFNESFPQDPAGAKSAALQFPWLIKSVNAWVMDVEQMTPERQKELKKRIHALPEEEQVEFTKEFAQQGIIGSSKEREATLAVMLKNVPPDRHETVKKSFYEKGITSGQMEHWLGYHAFKVPEGWDPKIVGKIMFSRLQNGVSNSMHDASYFLSHFVTPEEPQQDDEEETKKRKKSYNSVAQKWLINYVATPAETLILAWENRDAALADGCRDNPGALVQWAKVNAIKRLFAEYGQSLDLSKEVDLCKLAFLTETVRCTSPEKTLRIWRVIEASHNTESLFRPVKIDLGNGYSGEIFRKDDPRGTTIGADTGCCMSVGGASESCIIAGYTDPRYGFFALYHEGKLAAQSLIYINPEASSDTLVCDNIEACAGRDPRKITEYYKKFFAAYAPKNSTIISKVHIGMGYGDGGHELPLVPDLDIIQTALPIYTDANTTQRLLLDAKTLNTPENDLAIQWQDAKSCVHFTDTPVSVEWDDEDENDEDNEDEDEDEDDL